MQEDRQEIKEDEHDRTVRGLIEGIPEFEKLLKHDSRKTSRAPYIEVQYHYSFPNGYGASVIRGRYTIGGSNGLWEMAVLDHNGDITYDTPITRDVIGHLTDYEVYELLLKVKNL